MIYLSEDEVKALAPVLQRLQAHLSQQIDVVEMLRRWSVFVREVELGYELTGYDYANDLAIRDMLNAVVTVAPRALQNRIAREALDPLDQRFRDATREVSEPLRIAAPDRPLWWWFRVPNDVSGELASDLLA
ncbi:MAG: hypothetical protein M3Y30_14485 [Gemmatimonadota bacterium]|nr:hypothetical protein [Gemmatimonadota bacterium]